jgi:glyoxylase-like metal-dependent hydrolase (beta-lactamase superfamily II)
LISAYGAQPPNAPSIPPTLIEQLRSAGTAPDDIAEVVITHLHYDHFAGLTHLEGGKPVPSFPNARHTIPRKDWEMSDIAEGRKRGDKDLMDTLGVVEKAGLLELLDGKKDVGMGTTVLPSPGESPGHQIVRIESGGEVCYCVGDLYHMKEEVEHPELAASWADPSILVRSRNDFAERASKESALVLPGHMRPGRVALEAGRPRWTDS